MILPALKSTSLVSLGQLCDDGCKITLDENTLLATKNDIPVLRGYCNHGDSLWGISIPREQTIIISEKYHQLAYRPALYNKTPTTATINNVSAQRPQKKNNAYMNIFEKWKQY